ncbi:MAG: MFS transporter [Candidatus Hermodarchaeota archaeon]
MSADYIEKDQNLLDIDLRNNPIQNKEKADHTWKANIWKLYLINLFMGFHFISGILLPFFITWGNLTFIQVIVLQSYFTIMILLFEIPCGAIADYVSRKFSLVLGALIVALAALIYGSYPNIFIFIIGETLWAFATALTSGTEQAFIYDTLRKLEKEEDISKVTARNTSFFLLGLAISAPIGSFIGAYLALNLVMTIMFFPFLVATIISLSLKEPNHELERKKTENYLAIIKSGFKELRKNRILRIFAIEKISVEIIVSFLVWTYQIYLEKLNLQIIFFGLVSTLMTIIQIIMNNMIPKLENKVSNKKKILQVYTLIPGIGFILIAMIYYIPVSIPLILVIIGFGFSRRILFVKGINKQIKTQNRATVLSTINMAASLIRTVVYPLIAYIVTWNLSATFILLGTTIIFITLISRIRSEYL